MSHKKQIIRIKDLDTGEHFVFNTLQQACDYINQVTGGHATTSTLYHAIRKCGTVAKKRFQTCAEKFDDIPEPDRTKIEDGWEFIQYGVADNVLSCEKKFKWYDEDRIEDITNFLRENRCRVFWDMQLDTWWARKSTRAEIYKRFPANTPFEDKILKMKEIIKEAGL